ncbi:uncharacterized protein A4U43_C08F25180 [Asparagus officinalis]|nr:uncharacterized protein A4U43_C08F25180 [Asparagus officinalis]
MIDCYASNECLKREESWAVYMHLMYEPVEALVDELVKKLRQENKLHTMVDKSLKNNYDRIEVEEMVQVALLCTQFHPSHLPKM